MTFGEKIMQWNASLGGRIRVPEGIDVLNPFDDKDAMKVAKRYYDDFYNDNKTRVGVFGINPGRHGAGITGIPFTDPVHLESECGISNPFTKRAELSSTYVYQFINAFGGNQTFTSRFFLTAICPLGFIKEGKNINYYDDKSLLNHVEGFILETMREQVDMGLDTQTCLCLGEGANYKYLSAFNDKHALFDKVVPLAHPRFIMQYRRKKLDEYLQSFVTVLHDASV